MKRLTNKEKELVRIGAAMGSNCVVCIEYHILQARKAGLDDDQIRMAINFAKAVKKVPADLVFQAAMEKFKQSENWIR